MKNQTQKPAPASPKARRKTQPSKQPAPPLLTVTLDAQASACVRRFAEEFGEDVRDVASGGILDTLPQALQEWEHTKQRRENGESDVETYWQDAETCVRQARQRRGAKKAIAKGRSLPPGGALVLTLSLSGLTLQSYLANCKDEGQTPGEWLKKTVCSNLTNFFEFYLNKAADDGENLAGLFEKEMSTFG